MAGAGLQFQVVSECCPVGCGTEVVLLRAVRSGVLFAYCDGCGCVWHKPREAKFAAGVKYMTPAIEVAPDGAEVPSAAEISASPWEKSLMRLAPSGAWQRQLEELNESIRLGLSN